MPFLIVLLLLGAEIASIVVVGERLGLAGTLALQLAMMLLGAGVLRSSAWVLRPQARQEGRAARAAIAMMLTAFSGIVLMVPGFALDLPALLLLLPPVREAIAGWLAQKGMVALNIGQNGFGPGFGPGFGNEFDPSRQPGPARGQTVDVEATGRRDEPDPSPWRRPIGHDE